MPGFTYVVSVGMTGQKAGGAELDRAPLLLMEDPTESFLKSAGLADTEGLYYQRKIGSGDQEKSINTRPVLRIANEWPGGHAPRPEASGSFKYILWENGSMEFRPGTANALMMALMGNYKTAQHALVVSGSIQPSNIPTGSQTTAAIDLAALSELRLPMGYAGRAGMVPALMNDAGSAILNQNQTYGMAYQARLEKLIITAGNPSDTSGVALIPAGAMLFQIAYHVKDTTTTGVADLFDIGVAGDLTRFATGLDASSFATKGYVPDPVPFRHYDADTAVVVTLDGNAADTFEVMILTVYLIMTVAPNLS